MPKRAQEKLNKVCEMLQKRAETDIPRLSGNPFYSGLSNGMALQHPIHCHNNYEIFLTLSDDVIHLINGKRILLARYALVLIRPDDVHSQVFMRKDEEGKMINLIISCDTIRALVAYLHSCGTDISAFLTVELPPMKVLSRAQMRNVMKAFERELQMNVTQPAAYNLKCLSFLLYLFTDFFLVTHETENGIEPPYWLEVTIEKMKRPENFSLGLERMVELSGKSQEYLARSMKKYYGQTVTQYINDLRLSFLAGKLMQTDEMMLELIFDCGFQSVSHFYKLFAAKFGMSPSAYKERYKQVPWLTDNE